MRDKKMFISVILITTVMLFASGCSKQTESVSAEPTETTKEVDKKFRATPSPTVEPEENMESSEVEDNSEKEVDTAEEDNAVVEDTESTKTESNSNTSNGNTSNSNASSSNASDSNASNGNASAQPAQSTPVPTSTPVHEHTWTAHTAVSQTWIPNIVVVDDYENQITKYETYICYCGFETADANTIAQHIKDHVYAGEMEYAGFTIQTHSKTEQVKVGSHEEDQGHYETSTYVDYYYCECGATKNG